MQIENRKQIVEGDGLSNSTMAVANPNSSLARRDSSLLKTVTAPGTFRSLDPILMPLAVVGGLATALGGAKAYQYAQESSGLARLGRAIPNKSSIIDHYGEIAGFAYKEMLTPTTIKEHGDRFLVELHETAGTTGHLKATMSFDPFRFYGVLGRKELRTRGVKHYGADGYKVSRPEESRAISRFLGLTALNGGMGKELAKDLAAFCGILRACRTPDDEKAPGRWYQQATGKTPPKAWNNLAMGTTLELDVVVDRATGKIEKREVEVQLAPGARSNCVGLMQQHMKQKFGSVFVRLFKFALKTEDQMYHSAARRKLIINPAYWFSYQQKKDTGEIENKVNWKNVGLAAIAIGTTIAGLSYSSVAIAIGFKTAAVLTGAAVKLATLAMSGTFLGAVTAAVIVAAPIIVIALGAGAGPGQMMRDIGYFAKQGVKFGAMIALPGLGIAFFAKEALFDNERGINTILNEPGFKDAMLELHINKLNGATLEKWLSRVGKLIPW